MKKIVIVIVIILVSSCNFKSKTRQNILAQQKPLPNTYSLHKKVLETLAEKIEFKDTLYVVNQIIYGVCGNDEHFDDDIKILNKEEAKKVEDYVKNNPYKLNLREKPLILKIKNKVVISGTSFEKETFYYKNNRKEIEKIKNKIWYLESNLKNKDTVYITATKDKLKKIEFFLSRNNTLWNAHL